ncbi:hypothetical protein TNCV_3310351 [Trichonephila clavipes]|uniref:Uncharacterized protein n=1 Tax=Trichonephila clavipes TaxID=2585209 RepID=A0A8X6S664_TRICX|nr:hypothetical protein TNCV_3310351 [Trichonephila clavipes]
MEVQCWVTGPTHKWMMEESGRAGAVDLGDGGDVKILLPSPQTDDGGMREGPELSFLVLEVLCWFSGLTLQTDDGGMRKGIINDIYTFCYLEYFVRAGLVVHGDGGAVLGHRPYSQMDDGGIRELSFLVLEVLCWFSGLTLQTDDGGMRKGIINDIYTFCYLEYFVRAGLVVHGDGGAVLGHRPYSQMDDGGIREDQSCRSWCWVLCWFSGLTLQTDDGGMRKGIINDIYTFCYLEYFVRAGLVVHGDGGAVLGHRPYSQMDDGGIREPQTVDGEMREGRAGAVDLGDGGAVMILLPSPQTDDGGMREGRWEMIRNDINFFYFEYFVRAGAVDLGDGAAVKILRPYAKTDDGGMREGRAGAVDLGDGCAVMILRTYSQTDDGGMREGRAGAVDLGDGGAVMILRPTPQTDDGGMREGRREMIKE